LKSVLFSALEITFFSKLHAISHSFLKIITNIPSTTTDFFKKHPQQLPIFEILSENTSHSTDNPKQCQQTTRRVLTAILGSPFTTAAILIAAVCLVIHIIIEPVSPAITIPIKTRPETGPTAKTIILHTIHPFHKDLSAPTAPLEYIMQNAYGQKWCIRRTLFNKSPINVILSLTQYLIRRLKT